MIMQLKRLYSLVKRASYDLVLVIQSLVFSLRYRAQNNFSALFRFRLFIEVNHISPFRRLFASYPSQIALRLPQFGNVRLPFHLNDGFEMAVCQEFIKYNLYDLSALTFIPDVPIDCGAYKGYFSFRVNDRFKGCKKVCIEPHKRNLSQLSETIKNNGIKNIELINKALSRSNSKILLEEWGSNMSVGDFVSSDKILKEVDTIHLSALLKKFGPETKLLLKVDIEGSELDFFPDCIKELPDCCAVFLETHDGWKSLEGIKKTFIRYGFDFFVIHERNKYIDSFAIRNENVCNH